MATPSVTRSALGSTDQRLFIGGIWREATSGSRFPVEDPATLETIADVADADAADAVAAIEEAGRAFRRWRTASPRERAGILQRAFDLMIERREQLATIITLEMGKPLADARAEVDYAASFLRWYAEEAVRIRGATAEHESGGSQILTFMEPVGPCVFVTPWNFPLAMGTRKIAPALAAGCTCVIKPAEQTPLSMSALVRIFQEAGLPDGVLNLINTSRPGPVVEALLASPITRKVSFTGSTAIGKLLTRLAADQMLRVSMELGGNAPFLVLEGADLEAAVDGAMVAKMRNGGEACTSANRFLVHSAVADEFSERLAERMRSLRLGHGLDDGVDVGPLVDEAQLDKVTALVDNAVGHGARLLCGGAQPSHRGYFYAPTVLTGVPEQASLLHEEIFGPVAPVTVVSSDDEAVARANATEYGLVAYVYTRDLDRAFRVVRNLETGMVGLNQGIVSNAAAPFGGVKQSGLGREGGREGLQEYLETKYVAMSRPQG